MIRFLNLDLDFFVHGDIIHSPAKRVGRPTGSQRPWSSKELRNFLESKCVLSRERPVPGRFVVEHDAAFDYWHSLLRSQTDEITIALTHIDAHADLGMGDLSFRDLMGHHLHKQISERSNPKRGINGLNHGSYLAYAVACRWLSRIDFVLHPSWQNDLPWFYFKDFSELTDFDGCKYIQLRAFDARSFEDSLSLHWIEEEKPAAIEPEVPFCTIRAEAWKASGPFDFALLAQSPAFVSREADRLLGIFAEYIDFR
jgi:hypothetical protein